MSRSATIACALATVAAAAVLYKRRLEARYKGKNVHISQLYCYPIKSCACVELQTARLDRLGFEFDRRFMLVDADGVFVTQRKYPKMALITPRLPDDSSPHMRVDAPGMPTLHIQMRPERTGELDVQIWDDTVGVQAASAKADVWFTEYMGFDVRLVTTLSTQEHNRPLPAFVDSSDSQVHAAFADGFPLLVCSAASMRALNAALPLSNQASLRAFRPNIVVDGDLVEWAEDHWRSLSVGSEHIRLFLPKSCDRCSMPNVDQSTGKRLQGMEPITTLRRMHSAKDCVLFGENAIPDVASLGRSVSVGDSVLVEDIQHMSVQAKRAAFEWSASRNT